MSEPQIYATAAVFTTPEALIAAAEKCREHGYKDMDALTPFPVEGLDEALRIRTNAVARFAFIGGLTGALLGFGMQQYSTTVAYPLNVAGRSFFSWPAYIPVTFELTVLFAGFTAVISMFLINRLPNLHHPLLQQSRLAARDRFVLCVLASDPKYEHNRTRVFLESLDPESVEEVFE